MTLTEISMMLIACAGLILVFALVPTLLAVKRTAESVGQLTEMVRTELKPTIQELTGLVSELKTISRDLGENTGDVKCFLSAIGETGNSLHAINSSVNAVTGMIGTASAWMAGAKVAGKFVLQRYLNKLGGK
ncbi:MAG TPA: DUF948 domain-containing protein [Deltaproteobacteria bacterium]|nr:DUF948 domain-containing protein [Deltaproteobacteria bacterium]HQB39454.1 DUF948 domain-containing protein [Deltaproteobacteria bacterium]